MKSNRWLESPEFISKVKFFDLYYLETLFHKVAAFIKNAPIPILSTWDAQHGSIYLSVGGNKQFFPIDVNIAYYDYVTVMKRWCSQFYPSYKVQVNTQIPYTDSEIMLMVKDGMDLNDAILARKPHSYIEKGVIEKVYIKKEEFIFNINGQREIRCSGNILEGKIIPMSKFMESIRQIKTDEELKTYIFENSKRVSLINYSDEVIEIDYSGNQMINFFKINFEDLQVYELIEIDPFIYKWGNFLIKFESKMLAKDCIKIYTELKEK